MASRLSSAARCVVCSSPYAKLWGQRESYELYGCIDCGAVFTHPMPSQAELVRLYASAHYFEGGGTNGYVAGYGVSAEVQARQYETILDQIGPPQSDAKLLEVGCAEGYFLNAARRRGWVVHGVELSPIAAAAARERFGLQVVEGELDERTQGACDYGVIVLLDVIEHLSNPVRIVQTAARLLRSNGLLVIKTPDIGSPYARRLGVRWPQIKPPEHLVYFDSVSMSRMLGACGFEIDTRKSIGGTGLLAALHQYTRAHAASGCPRTFRALSAVRRWKWVGWSVARASAIAGRQDVMIVLARKNSPGVANADPVGCSE